METRRIKSLWQEDRSRVLMLESGKGGRFPEEVIWEGREHETDLVGNGNHGQLSPTFPAYGAQCRMFQNSKGPPQEERNSSNPPTYVNSGRNGRSWLECGSSFIVSRSMDQGWAAGGDENQLLVESPLYPLVKGH